MRLGSAQRDGPDERIQRERQILVRSQRDWTLRSPADGLPKSLDVESPARRFDPPEPAKRVGQDRSPVVRVVATVSEHES